MPLLSESFGIVNVEAMACGTPVIASDIEGIRDIIESGKSGILVPPDDPIKLAEAIQFLLDNDDIRIKFGAEGRKKVEKEFSWDVIVARLLEIYKEII
jgi:glycosyltransferase involved in cell wall biosynthesis